MPDPPQRQSKTDEPVGEARSDPLHALFEDVTGSAEIVAEQEPSASTRDVDDATTALSEYVKTVMMDDGVTDAIDEPEMGTD